VFTIAEIYLKETARQYTYADYEKLDDGNRYELIDGVVYLMSPGASQAHQGISGEFFSQLYNFLKGKPCEAYYAPFDVCLNAER